MNNEILKPALKSILRSLWEVYRGHPQSLKLLRAIQQLEKLLEAVKKEGE